MQGIIKQQLLAPISETMLKRLLYEVKMKLTLMMHLWLGVVKVRRSVEVWWGGVAWLWWLVLICTNTERKQRWLLQYKSISWSKLSFEMKIHQIYHHTFNLSTLFLLLSPVWWIISNDSCLRSLSNADDCQGLQMSPTHDLSSLFISWSVVTSGQTLQLLPFSNHSHINTVSQ